MSSNDPPSGSTPKAIGSLAKKQSDVTRQGTQKLKFVPTLPQRRKKEEVKAEPTTSVVPAVPSTERGRGRGRGKGDGRGRGRGRGAAPPVLEMTASGPFAMGPALAGSTGRRSTPRSNFTPSVPTALGASAALGVNLSRSAAPSLKKENNADAKGKGKAMEEEGEVYSDPDDGVEIIDMERIRDMDWMAPESLQNERQLKKFKKEPSEGVAGEVDLAKALDLSESEEEEELEDIIEDFAAPTEIDTDPTLREERLYFFQFPQPFPTFLPKASESVADVIMGDATDKKVTFAPDVMPSVTPGTSRTSSAVPTELLMTEPLDGIIGELEVYRSGAVKIRLTNGILFDVSAGTQPSFLQQVTYLDKENKRLCVLGEVNKQFVVSPNVDTLLAAMEEADNAPVTIEGGENLIKMDG
ncbi:RNA polymerase III RPC4-domain-containing protein [Crucibulum laeve]|uniref:RNA polymerase III RPC4-domain-containing protein n=1 Tax=Crucibulum laeve TaxID=68775 RepID=A0A5C3LKK3_9AGAR|nr:RNA polymerase III RPC4-domain-containing protein [Crucibulum laeve]